MIKFSQRQINTFLDAVKNHYIAACNLHHTSQLRELAKYTKECAYLNGVCDALNIYVTRATCDELAPIYLVYTSECFEAAKDVNGNNIQIMEIDANERKITYNIFEAQDSYSKKYAKQLQEGIKEYYKKIYNEDT